MTIDEAIKLLGIEDRRSYPKRRLEAHTATKLGIEALKHYRESSHFACGCLLPGQTGETKE